MNPFCDLFRYIPHSAERRGIKKVTHILGAALVAPGWHFMFWFRLSALCYRLRLYPIGWLIYRLNLFVFSIDIPPDTSIGPGCWFPHPLGIVIARDTTIGRNTSILHNVTIGGRHDPVVIGDNVLLGAGAVVLGGVVLGDGVRVGANAVVTKSFPAGVTLVGVPARELERGK